MPRRASAVRILVPLRIVAPSSVVAFPRLGRALASTAVPLTRCLPPRLGAMPHADTASLLAPAVLTPMPCACRCSFTAVFAYAWPSLRRTEPPLTGQRLHRRRSHAPPSPSSRRRAAACTAPTSHWPPPSRASAGCVAVLARAAGRHVVLLHASCCAAPPSCCACPASPPPCRHALGHHAAAAPPPSTPLSLVLGSATDIDLVAILPLLPRCMLVARCCKLAACLLGCCCQAMPLLQLAPLLGHLRP